MTLYLILGAGAVIAIMALTIKVQHAALNDAKKTASYYMQTNRELSKTISTLQEAQRVQEDRTEKIATGSDADRVAGSIDVLSNISSSGATRSGKNKLGSIP